MMRESSNTPVSAASFDYIEVFYGGITVLIPIDYADEYESYIYESLEYAKKK